MPVLHGGWTHFYYYSLFSKLCTKWMLQQKTNSCTVLKVNELEQVGKITTWISGYISRPNYPWSSWAFSQSHLATWQLQPITSDRCLCVCLRHFSANRLWHTLLLCKSCPSILKTSLSSIGLINTIIVITWICLHVHTHALLTLLLVVLNNFAVTSVEPVRTRWLSGWQAIDVIEREWPVWPGGKHNQELVLRCMHMRRTRDTNIHDQQACINSSQWRWIVLCTDKLIIVDLN